MNLRECLFPGLSAVHVSMISGIGPDLSTLRYRRSWDLQLQLTAKSLPVLEPAICSKVAIEF
jgi:hypothetical protein